MSHEPWTEWAAFYAIQALDGEEQRLFEAHLATGCRDCTTLLADLAAVVATLAWAAPAVAPPSALRAQLLARLHPAQPPSEPAPLARRRRTPDWVWWYCALWAGRVAVAGFIAVLGVALYDAHLQLGTQQQITQQLAQELTRERVLTNLVAHTDTRVVALSSPQPTTPPAAGWIVWSPEKHHGFIVVHYLPALPVGQTYQLWAITGQRALSASVFRVDEVGHTALMVPVAVAHPDRFAITVEPVGGVAEPSGPVLMYGNP